MTNLALYFFTVEEKDILRSLSHSSGGNKLRKPVDLRSNRPVSLEMPLIDSQASTPLSTSSPFFGQKPMTAAAATANN